MHNIPNTHEVRIETSTLCNAACVFCPWPTDGFTRKKEVMSYDDYAFYIDKAKDELGDKFTETTISGFGEAFIDKGILDKMKYASKKELDIHVLTNGSLLSKSKIDTMFDLPILNLRVSLHTTNPDSYGKILNFKNKRFDLNNVLDLINYAISIKPDTVNIIITADIVDENKNDVQKMIDDFEDRCSLEIWHPHNWVDNLDYRKDDLLVTKDTCGRPFNGPIQIQIDGDVIMCCFDFNNDMVIGNFKEQTLEEIFTIDGNNLFSKIYNHHSKGTCGDSDLICANCDQLKTSPNVVIYNNRVNDNSDRIKMTSTSMEDICQ